MRRIREALAFAAGALALWAGLGVASAVAAESLEAKGRNEGLTVAFSEPYLGFSQAMAVPKGSPDALQTIEDVVAKGLKVAVIAGSAQVGYAAGAGHVEMLGRNGLSADELPRFSTEDLCAGK